MARRLIAAGEVDSTVLTAAILHDTVEDTETTFEEITGKFGAEVSSLVRECTDDKTLPKAERKRLQVEHAPDKSRGAKCIKIADKTSNVEDIRVSPPADWTKERIIEYLNWGEQVVRGLSGVNEKLEAGYATAIEKARKVLE